MQAHDPPSAARRGGAAPHRGSAATPAQAFGALGGTFLALLGLFALVFTDVSFGTVGAEQPQPQFLLWKVSGWTVLLWLAMGGLGLALMAQIETARMYALTAAALFGVLSVWGFVTGTDIAGVVAVNAANNVTHAVLALAGLLWGALPPRAQSPLEAERREQPSGRREAIADRYASGRR